MKIVIAPDSFKGSLTSTEAANIMKKAVLEVIEEAEVHAMPMADGGEGTLDALIASSGGKRIPIVCTGPLGKRIETSYGMLPDGTAVIECAAIAELTQVPESQRNPDHTTSFGIGEVMRDALERGCTTFIVGLGGSATNDGGLGMLQALGMEALDKNGVEVCQFGRDLLKVASVNFNGLDSRLANVHIKVASDVKNPLCGERGATAVYGPQKGATPEQVKRYDEALSRYSNLIEEEVGKAFKDVEGAGAAGGLGFALLALGAELFSGAKLVADAAGLTEAIRDADLVLTGEGQTDEQTLYGKAPGFIAEPAKEFDVPAVLISGSLSGDLDKLRENFAGCFSIINRPMALEVAMEKAGELLYEQTKQVVHLVTSVNLDKGAGCGH